MTRPLTNRWTPLRYHQGQRRLWTARSRFRVVPPGRRSGKTELAKRYIVRKATAPNQPPNALYLAAAPTHAQAKQIFWSDLKQLIPRCWVRTIREGDREILLVNDATIRVAGMDRPERTEGKPLDGIVLDEYANMKASAWTENIRPALSTPGRAPGWAWFIGVPEGRNHYHDLYQRALGDHSGEWTAHHWVSADIVDPVEIESARRDLDERVFRQEYEGSFEAWEGRCYYGFDRAANVRHALSGLYDPEAELIFALDFNVSPGVAAIGQEVSVARLRERPDFADATCLAGMADHETVTCWISEEWIARDSNTLKIVGLLRDRWKKHRGAVSFYGDATGGAGGSAKIWGSDWELARDAVRTAWDGRVSFRVRRANPSERVRVNAVNTRLRNADGQSRMFVDSKCKHLIDDFDSVPALDDGSIDKKADPRLTHISDGAGYYVEYRWPVAKRYTSLEAA